MEKEKKKGRPKKFSTTDLKEIIKLFVLKNKHNPITLTPMKLANFASELGKKAHYQDFTRNSEIVEYMTKYNEALKNIILKPVVGTSTPVYENLDVQKFLNKNNSRDKLEKALTSLDVSKEKLVTQYGDLEGKYLELSEKLMMKRNEIENLNAEISNFENQKKQAILSYKEKNKILQEKLTKERAKNIIYEDFIRKYHMDIIAQQALYIETITTEDVLPNNKDIFNSEAYKESEYNLALVIERYAKLVNKINTLNIDDNDNEQPINEEEIADEYKELLNIVEINESDLKKKPMELDAETVKNNLIGIFD